MTNSRQEGMDGRAPNALEIRDTTMRFAAAVAAVLGARCLVGRALDVVRTVGGVLWRRHDSSRRRCPSCRRALLETEAGAGHVGVDARQSVGGHERDVVDVAVRLGQDVETRQLVSLGRRGGEATWAEVIPPVRDSLSRDCQVAGTHPRPRSSGKRRMLSSW